MSAAMKNLIVFVVVLLVLFPGCKQQNQSPVTDLASHNGPVKITGAYALLPLMQLWINEFQKLHPEIKFELQPNGSGRGLTVLMNGNADLSMVSGEIPMDKDSLIWIAPVSRLATVLIFNPGNPYMKEILARGMNRDDLTAIFTNDSPKKWGDLFGKPGKDPVHVYLRSDSSGATDVLAKYLWITPGNIKGTGVSGEDKMIEAIKKDPLALGYCNFIWAFDPGTLRFNNGFNVLPLDMNNNSKLDAKESFYDSVPLLQRAMWSGKFPCALTRPLSLASKGKPGTKEVVEFLKYILTDGQRLVAKEGYIELHRSENRCRVFFLDNVSP
jgi:phosphate transport system substrate-binding protein